MVSRSLYEVGEGVTERRALDAKRGDGVATAGMAVVRREGRRKMRKVGETI
jgi:hypothetical protein